MKIGIIGAGNIGGNLTRRLTELGHDVAVANSRGPETLVDLSESTGAHAADVTRVAQGAELVIVSIPEKNVPDLPKGVLEGAKADLVVIDTGNYYPQQRDGLIADIENGMTESRWVAMQLGHAVIKAFNGIYAANILERPRPVGSPERIALPVAGDDDVAKKVVMDLIVELGFDAVDAGDVDESWRQQPGTPCYGATTDSEGLRRLLGEAVNERTAEWRA